MKYTYYLFCAIGLATLSFCSKKQVENPELDFSTVKIYTPLEIFSYKVSIGCGETAYWEGKKIKIKGYISELNINTKSSNFFLYDNADILNPKSQFISINYNKSIDSAKITKLLLENKNKPCTVSATCSSKDLPTNNSCSRSMTPNVESLNDISF